MKRWLCLVLLLPATGGSVPYRPKTIQAELPRPVELPVVAAPEGVPASMDLHEALATALVHQPSLQAAESQIRAAEGRVRQQAAGLRPRVLLQSTYNEQVINRAGGDLGAIFANNGWTHNASLSQLLTDGGHTRDLTAAQEHAREASRAAYEQARADLALQVKQAYFQLLSSQRLVGVQQDNLINRREHVAEARSRLAGGLGLPSDVTRAETALSAALYQLSQAHTRVATDQLQFNLALGLDPRVQVQLRAQEESLPAFSSSQQLFELALVRRPELEKFRKQLDSAQSTLDAAHTTSTPSLSLNAAYQNRQSPAIESLGINLVISFQALDGGLQDGRIREAEASRDRARAELESARQLVLSQVGQAFLNLKNAEQQVAAASAEEANAQETLRLTNGRYKVGLGIFLNVLDAQSAWLTAQTNRVNALTQVYLSRAALTRAIHGNSFE
jgi:outer membrane protein